MCCPDIEAETPPKGPVSATPVWRTVRSSENRARDCWREKGWAWDQCDSDQLTEFFKQELEEEWGIDEAELSWRRWKISNRESPYLRPGRIALFRQRVRRSGPPYRRLPPALRAHIQAQADVRQPVERALGRGVGTPGHAEVNSNLKRNLSEQNMPERLIVIATSNDASGLDEALLQRFEVFPFSAGPTFAEACQERLAWIWEQEAGPDVPMPLGMEQMGWRNGNYSMRRAMTGLGGALELRAGRGWPHETCQTLQCVRSVLGNVLP